MLNSGGRLERQDKYIDILIKDEAEKAAELAKDLFELNRKRQALTEEGIQAGVAQKMCIRDRYSPMSSWN